MKNKKNRMSTFERIKESFTKSMSKEIALSSEKEPLVMAISELLGTCIAEPE